MGLLGLVLVVRTPMVVAVVKVGVRVSAMVVVVSEVVGVVSVIVRGVSPVQLVFPSDLLKTLARLFRR